MGQKYSFARFLKNFILELLLDFGGEEKILAYCYCFGCRDMDQNALSQSDCRIFKSAIFPEQSDD